MIRLTKILFAVLVLGSGLSVIPAQSTSKPNPSPRTLSTITGRVTFHGKGLGGITVAAWNRSSIEPPTQGTMVALTGPDGSYRIANVPTGNYSIAPRSPEYVFTNNGDPAPPKYFAITNTEAIGAIDFEISRGGVITGTITNSDDKPIIEEFVTFIRVDPEPPGGSNSIPAGRLSGRTDDRGIYRMYGIPPGHYKVAAGWPMTAQATLTGRPAYPRVFYPDATDESKAEVINLSEGTERSRVDINVGAVVKTVTISGKIIDDATGQPIPNLSYGLQGFSGGRPAGAVSQPGSTNERGEFRLQNMPAGRYALLVPSYMIPVDAPPPAFYGDLAPFDVADDDVTGLEVRLHRTLDVSGVVVFEGTNRGVLAQIPQLWVRVTSMKIGSPVSFQNSNIDSDWTFTVSGLRPGELSFSLGSPTGVTPFQIKRIERDGVEQTRNVEIKPGEHVAGIRLVVVYATGTVRGLVKFENGTLPQNARVVARLWPTTETQSRNPIAGAFVDPRGHFLMEPVPAGNYRLTVSAEFAGAGKRPGAEQAIEIPEGGVADVTLSLDLTPDPTRRPAPQVSLRRGID